MNRKMYIIIEITIIVLIVGYIGFKSHVLNKFNINPEVQEIIKEKTTIDKTITIKNVKLEESEYRKYRNIKIRNDFEEYEKQICLTELGEERECENYDIYESHDNPQSTFLIGQWYQYITLFKRMPKTETLMIDITEIYKKNNIKNDIDLIKYWNQIKIEKGNIFSNINQVTEKYIMAMLALNSFPNYENITVIDGDYTGYIATTEENIKEIYLLENDRCYLIKIEKPLLTPEELTEYVIDLISTIVIE